MKRLFFSISLWITFQNAYSQDMLGIVNSNYAGSAGLTLNPATVAGMPFRHEINIFSQQLSIQNNYLYMPAGSNLSNLFKGQSPSHIIDDVNKITSSVMKLNLSTYAKGPSYLSSSRNRGWAIHTAMRMDLNVSGLSFNFANLLAEGINAAASHELEVEYKVDPYQLNMLQWYETGFTFGGTIVESRKHLITAGATVNIELGANAVNIKSEQMSFHVSAADTFKVYNLTGTYAHTITNNNPGINDIMGIKGLGGGLNLGVQYYFLRNENVVDALMKNNRRYFLKVGASLIDLGKVHFDKETRVNKFHNSSATWASLSKLKFEGINEFDESLSEAFTGTTNGALKKKSMDVALPTAASIQLDVNLFRNFFLNTTWIQGVAVAKSQVMRASQLSITARFQTANFEVAVPYSLYDYYKNRVGLCIRYKCFFIGTDQLGSYTGISATDGMSGYFGVRIYR